MKKLIYVVLFLAAILLPAMAIPVQISVVSNNGSVSLLYGANNSRTYACDQFRLDSFGFEYEVPASAYQQYVTNVSCKLPDKMECDLTTSSRADLAGIRGDFAETKNELIKDLPTAILTKTNLSTLVEECKNSGTYQGQLSQKNAQINILEQQNQMLATFIVLLAIITGVLILEIKTEFISKFILKKKGDIPLPPIRP